MRRLDRTTAETIRRYLVRLPKREFQNEQWALLVARTRPIPAPRPIPRRDPYWWHRKRTRRHRPAAALAVVQAKNNTQTTSASCQVTITTSAGNLIVAAFDQNVNNTQTLSVTDSNSATYTQAGGYASGTTSQRSAMFYLENAAAVTFVKGTWGSISGRIGGRVFEISGAATSSPLDAAASTTGAGSATSLASGSLTTTNANDILIVDTATTSVNTVAAGTGYTNPTGSQSQRGGMSYKIVAATQSGVTTTQSWGTTSTCSCCFAGFKAAAGGTNITVTLSGSSMTATAGNLSETGDANLTISGSSMTGTAGNLSPSGGATVALSGSSMTSAAGSLSVTGDANVPLSGSSITAAAGNLSITGTANVTLVGSSLTSSAGTLSVSTGTNITVALTGSSITSAAGNLATSGDANVSLTGLSIGTSTGTVTVTTTSGGTKFVIWIQEDAS